MNPEGLKRVPGSPEEWLEYAESDLRLAQMASQNPGIRREQVCFHTQQAAEKSIKAVLLLHRINFPLTHNIEQLLSLAESSGVVLADEVRNAGLLTPYAVETRYPGPWIEIGDSEVQEALQTAEKTLSWASELISRKEGENS